VGLEKINELKGKLIALEEKREKLKSELDGLRNIKKDQKKTMNGVLETKNFPDKMNDLRSAIESLKSEKREHEFNLKELESTKAQNF
jgi:seryl-tRNA synthetase